MLIIILSFCAFFLTFPSDVNPQFFPSFFLNQNRLGFKKILRSDFEIKSLLQCFRLRIRVQVFRPYLGSVRSPPLLHLVTHLLINTNLLTSYASVYNRKNILNSSLSWSKNSQTNLWYRLLCFSASYGFTQHFLFLVFETLLCFLLYFINYEDVATTQIAPIFFF